MTTYNPDNWVIIEIDDGKEIGRKVLAGWSGGYLYGDSWRLSSGITNIVIDGNLVNIYNESGSIYICHIEREFMSMYMQEIYQEFLDCKPDNATIEILKLENIFGE